MSVALDIGNWAGVVGEIAREVDIRRDQCLAAYREDPTRVEEDARRERAASEVGYGRKQINELVQNGADAMLSSPGAIEIVLTPNNLYVANEGAPLSMDGLVALLYSHLSEKRGDEIGRYGLGFKSVAAISDSPRMISRSGSFGWDRERSRRAVGDAVGHAEDVPLLRLAWPIDPFAEAEADPLLASLMGWATTVVKLPLAASMDEVMADMQRFPSSFLVFAPHVRSIRMRILWAEGEEAVRDIRATWDRNRVKITADENGADSVTIWRVFRIDHQPSQAALEDAGSADQRETVRLTWAVPEGSSAELGSFSAFFPLEMSTTLRGILNAPWKLTEDRRTLLEGDFNGEILTEVLPRLVEKSLPELVGHDPTGYLDLLPARGREQRNWADDTLNEPLYEHLRGTRSLVAMDGELQFPSRLTFHPADLDPAWKDIWADVVGPNSAWVHHGIDATTTRRAKAERLSAVPGNKHTDARRWLEWLAKDCGPRGSVGAILIAEAVRKSEGGDRPSGSRESNESLFSPQVSHAEIVLTEDGNHVPPVRGRVFFRSLDDESGTFVDVDVAENTAARDALTSEFKIGQLDASGLVARALGRRIVDWAEVWKRGQALRPGRLAELIRDAAKSTPTEKFVKARARDGEWRPIGEMLSGGSLLRNAGPDGARFVLDRRTHSGDLPVLEGLGLREGPRMSSSTTPKEPWLERYEADVREEYRVSKKAKFRDDSITIGGPRPLYPLQMLEELSPASKVEFTAEALKFADPQQWTVRHRSQVSAGAIKVLSPDAYRLRAHGLLQTPLGPWPPSQTLDRSVLDQIDPMFGGMLPIVGDDVMSTSVLGLREDIDEFSVEEWEHILSIVEQRFPPEKQIVFYTYVAEYIPRPQYMIARRAGAWEKAESTTVRVASNDQSYQALRQQQIPAILVSDAVGRDILLEKWSMRDGDDEVKFEIEFEATGGAEYVLDRFPELKIHVPYERLDGLKMQRCSSIDHITFTDEGSHSEPRATGMVEGIVLLTAATDEMMLRQLSDQAELELSNSAIQRILDTARRRETSVLERQLGTFTDDFERLAHAVGDEALRTVVPAQALEIAAQKKGSEVTGAELARLAVAVNGSGTLALPALVSVLEDRGLNPPQSWAGGRNAVRWVQKLGFDAKWAGVASGGAREPSVVIDGPIDLPPLHDYQEAVKTKVLDLIGDRVDASRGLLALPTGAGKTRTAIDSIVQGVHEGCVTGPIVWIAQTDELCEQAVQTWMTIWRASGTSNTPLAIDRFWGGSELVEHPEALTVVVSTPQTLGNTAKDAAAGDDSKEWLTIADLVVVDEAHTSTAPSYTTVLEWLGRGRGRRERRKLIGLSATPFRGRSDHETERLVARYDGHRLDEGVFGDVDPHEHLQGMGVLARVEQEIIQGSSISLDAGELRQLQEHGLIPRGAEKRLGDDADRTRRIADSIMELPADWPILLFATSVENAKVLAAYLSFSGINAASIDGMTPAAERRESIRRFHEGELRVLTNYNVLAQGFDAPRVRAVYVTRPTWSPNLYQQMIGRGLRGPLNGGSEVVTIFNVSDNIEQYGEKLAFTHFEYLWST
ncbi:MAG TPA: DEAD/DEAH box helicase family protein [Actinomycetaceae bacterium]|nr:DEAD/DEAH box helicase family protein [Actinomycetaceae bacterium]